MAILLFGLFFSSCDKDDDEKSDLASSVSGIYTGKLSIGSTVIEDAYVVMITKISSTIVRVDADFYADGHKNYNVKDAGSQIVLEDSTDTLTNISISGKSISISFLNENNTMTKFIGIKD